MLAEEKEPSLVIWLPVSCLCIFKQPQLNSLPYQARCGWNCSFHHLWVPYWGLIDICLYLKTQEKSINTCFGQEELDVIYQAQKEGGMSEVEPGVYIDTSCTQHRKPEPWQENGIQYPAERHVAALEHGGFLCSLLFFFFPARSQLPTYQQKV